MPSVSSTKTVDSKPLEEEIHSSKSRRGRKAAVKKTTLNSVKPTLSSSKSPPKAIRPAKKASKTSKVTNHTAEKAPLLAKAQGKNGKATGKSQILRRRKTHLSAEELAEFRQMLVEKRRELVGDVTNLQNEAMQQGSSGEGHKSSMPIHMADLGSDTWEQELTLGLIENERSLLREIDEALDRIENKTYGICLATNKIISKSRLRAQPWAKYCIAYARKRELGLI